MGDFDSRRVVQSVREDNEPIAHWLSYGSDRIEHLREIKFGPIPVGEKVRRVPRTKDLDALLGAAVVAGYQQAMKDFEIQEEGEQ